MFKEANELLDIKDIAEWLGLHIGHGDFVLCPFHREKTASMKLYGNTYYCFGCHAHGDTINLTAEVLSVTPFEALKELNNHFNLNLFADENKGKKLKPKETPSADYVSWWKESLDNIAFVCRTMLTYGMYSEADIAEALHNNILNSTPELAYREYFREVEKYDGFKQRHKAIRQICDSGTISIDGINKILERAGKVPIDKTAGI